MKTLSLSGYALSVCVAAALLAGCGGSQLSPIGPSGIGASVPGSVRMEPARGGNRCPPPFHALEADALFFEARQKIHLETELITYYSLGSINCVAQRSSPSARWTSSGGDLDVRKPRNRAVFSATPGTYVVTARFGGAISTVNLTVQIHDERLLFGFGCSPSQKCGSVPQAGLLAGSGGTFFGTTAYGGSTSCVYSQGCGTVFSLVRGASGTKVTTLYAFQGGSDGALPAAALISDATGALYGTTTNGGSANDGTVFRLTPSGSGYAETVLYSFQGGTDGVDPMSGLIEDKKGALYGTTAGGGSSNGGTVYRLTPAGTGYAETIVYSFPSQSQPYGGLIEDKYGALYGTTVNGGSHGWGSVFRLTPRGSSYQEADLYSFTGGSDGANPFSSLIDDESGALYGTANGGGAGVGNVFKLAPKGSGYNETVLYSFQGGSDGANPTAALIRVAGKLYGTTEYGGDYGTVFKLSPRGSTYSESVLHKFAYSKLDGGYPICTLIANAGVLYGTTLYGGPAGNGPSTGGTIFRVKL